MAGPSENMKKGWKSISSVIDIDEPEPYMADTLDASMRGRTTLS